MHVLSQDFRLTGFYIVITCMSSSMILMAVIG